MAQDRNRRDTSRGSRSLSGRRVAPLRWLPWLGLALLALIALIAFLVIRSLADDDDESTVDATNAAGTLTAGGKALLPPSSAGPLGSLSGQEVSGRGVTVESVVADEGFWVGASPTERLFVSLLPEARGGSGESPFQARAGQRVDLVGVLRPVPTDVGRLGVDDAEGAAQLRSQGQYIEARAVTLA